MKKTTQSGVVLGRSLTLCETKTQTGQCAVSGAPGPLRDRRKRALSQTAARALAGRGLTVDRHGNIVRPTAEPTQEPTKENT